MSEREIFEQDFRSYLGLRVFLFNNFVKHFYDASCVSPFSGIKLISSFECSYDVESLSVCVLVNYKYQTRGGKKSDLCLFFLSPHVTLWAARLVSQMSVLASLNREKYEMSTERARGNSLLIFSTTFRRFMTAKTFRRSFHLSPLEEPFFLPSPIPPFDGPN